MIIALVLMLAAQTTAPAPAPDPVKKPTWINVPNSALMQNCTTGYLTDPAFTGETIFMGCLVKSDGTFGNCKVRETKRAMAAGVQDVAICAAAGFRIGPIDQFGKPTAGRPIILPLAIVTSEPPAEKTAQPSGSSPK